VIDRQFSVRTCSTYRPSDRKKNREVSFLYPFLNVHHRHVCVCVCVCDATTTIELFLLGYSLLSDTRTTLNAVSVFFTTKKNDNIT